MKTTTKKTLREMIGEMLQVEGLTTSQMQIIDMLCKINESHEITESAEYYDIKDGMLIDKFDDFVVENDNEIWRAFNSCKELEKNSDITKLVLLNVKERDGEKEDTRIIVNFKYIGEIPKFCYVRIVYSIKDKAGNIEKSIFNWNDEVDEYAFRFDEIESHDKKSDFFIKIMLD